MIKLTDKDKTLTIPSGLGNFGQGSGSGGGVTPEEAAQIASAVTAEALDEYDTELQVDLEDIRDAVSGNSEDIATLSATTGEISQQIGSLSGLTDDIAAISGQTTANTQDIGTLSGDVETNALAIANLENNVVPEIQSAITEVGRIADSANTKVEALSAVTSALTQTVSGKQDALTAGNGIDLSGSTISVKIGDGLGFSGDTLVVSGGTGGGPAVYVVNLLTEQERIALYNELMAYRYAPSYIGIQSGFPASDYAFYYWAGDDTSDEFNGDFRGFVPLQLAALHPDDYGGAAFFSGMVLSRNGGGLIRTIKYIITSDGSVDMARGTNNWDPHPEASYIYVDSDGTFRSELWSLGNITNTDIIYRLNVRYNNNDNYSLGPVTEYRKNTEEVATDDWRNVYYFSTVININGTTYKGTWRLVDYGDWEGQGPYPATSWTTV